MYIFNKECVRTCCQILTHAATFMRGCHRNTKHESLSITNTQNHITKSQRITVTEENKYTSRVTPSFPLCSRLWSQGCKRTPCYCDVTDVRGMQCAGQMTPASPVPTVALPEHLPMSASLLPPSLCCCRG